MDRDPPSRLPRSPPAPPTHTYSHTYPPSRRKKSRAITSKAGQGQSQSHQVPGNVTVKSGPEPKPFTSASGPAAVPTQQPNNKSSFPTATAAAVNANPPPLFLSSPPPPTAAPPPPRPLPLPTPLALLLPRPSPQLLKQQQGRMGTEHRDHRDGKPGLLTWWQKHTAQKPRSPGSAAALERAQKALDYVPPPPGIVFGRPLKESLKFANVQVSTADTSGQLYVWGYIPVVVAKWCVLVLVLSFLPSFFFILPCLSISSSFSFSLEKSECADDELSRLLL